MASPTQSFPLPPHQKPKRPANTGLIAGLIAGGLALVICAACAVAGLISNKQNPQAAAPTPAATQFTANAGGNPAPASPSPSVLAMPDVVGKNAAVAMDELERLGFTKIQYGSQDLEDTVVIIAANWTVTKQSTPPGTQAPADALIVLTCTKKKQP
ncbi:PASTA domain-containing protein [Dactylosporangium sp. NPDC049525]|uniref:Stk1 family PASTA domain-containing Ser/Thr kinase n=1 Tax=Dactylosporangium sp. NPDC049525 TaxID=3154730 RepID=UPI003448E5CB